MWIEVDLSGRNRKSRARRGSRRPRGGRERSEMELRSPGELQKTRNHLGASKMSDRCDLSGRNRKKTNKKKIQKNVRDKKCSEKNCGTSDPKSTLTAATFPTTIR